MNTDTCIYLRAIVWKEMRENAKWAVLGMIGVALALFYTIARQLGGDYSNGLSAVWSNAGQVMTFSGLLIGLALGLLQILPELRRNQWAFLVHRPASRGTLFWGKAITGMGLTLAASLIPLILLALWASAPGDIPAPFDPRLLLGGLASSFTGLFFYAAGLLTALRPVRWYGSRAVPIAAAVACAMVVASMPDFWQAAVAIGVFLAIFLCAAHGSFLTTGQYQRQPRTAKISLGITLFTGLVAVLVTIGIVSFSVLAPIFRSPSAPPVQIAWSDFQITRSGQVVRITVDGFALIKVTDLAGRPIKGFAKGSTYKAQDFLCSNFVQAGTGQVNYSAPDRYIKMLGTVGSPQDGTIWYYASNLRQVAAYSLRDRYQIGSIGADGAFSRNNRTARPFPRYLLSVMQDTPTGTQSLLLFRHQAYLLFAEKQTIDPLKTYDPETLLSSIQIVDWDNGNPSDTQEPLAYLLNAGDRFLIYSPHGKLLLRVPREYSQKNYPDVYVSRTPNGQRYFFRYYPPWLNGSIQRAPTLMTEVSSNGAVVAKYVLPSIYNEEVLPPSFLVSLYGIALPSSAVAAVNILGYATRHSDSGIFAGVWYNVADDLKVWVWLCFLSVLSGILAAILAWLIGRRCAFSRRGRWAWTVGTFWLGLLGVLLLLSLRDWPARVVCAHCGRLRVVNRDRCEHCGAEFPSLPRDGTEILDNSDDDRALTAHT